MCVREREREQEVIKILEMELGSHKGWFVPLLQVCVCLCACLRERERERERER